MHKSLNAMPGTINAGLILAQNLQKKIFTIAWKSLDSTRQLRFV
jgi:hypothetical protein